MKFMKILMPIGILSCALFMSAAGGCESNTQPPQSSSGVTKATIAIKPSMTFRG